MSDSTMSTWYFDIESYHPLFYAAFKAVDTGEVRDFFYFGESAVVDREAIAAFLKGKTLLGFNNLGYDDLMLLALLHSPNECGPTVGYLKGVSDAIITGGEGWERPWQKEKRIAEHLGFERLPQKTWTPIDFMAMAFMDEGRPKASLKTLAARIHTPRLKSLPYPPDTFLTQEQANEVADYCRNDLAYLEGVHKWLEQDIALRQKLSAQFGIDLTNKTNAEISEAVILREYCKRANITEVNVRKLNKPTYPVIRLKDILAKPDLSKNPETQKVVDYWRTIELKGESRGGFGYKYPSIKTEIEFYGKSYMLGAGGIHSNDKPGIFRSDDEHAIIYADVASQYPAIMLKLGSFPQHLGPSVLEVLRELRDKRIEAKRAGDKQTAQSLKIVILSYFGKSNSPFSPLYDAANLYRTTINGQLYSLILIENLEKHGFEVISANTDGIMAKVRRDRIVEYEEILHRWEKEHGFDLEIEVCRMYARTSVNDAIIEFENGKVRAVGDFRLGPDLYRDEPNKNSVIAQAVQKYLLQGAKPGDTIRDCRDPFSFCSFDRATKADDGQQRVLWIDGQQQEKAVRFYWSKSSSQILKRGINWASSDRVGNADRIRLALNISEFDWEDLDLARYEAKAIEIIAKLEGQVSKGKVVESAAGKEKEKTLFAEVGLPEEIRALDEIGLVLVPSKKDKHCPSGYRNIYPDRDYTRYWDWTKYPGAAIFTGPETLTLAIDIDTLEKAREFFKASPFPELPETMAIGHGVDLDKVRRLEVRGSLVFTIDKAKRFSIKGTSTDFLAKHGFEVLYNGDQQKVLGKHKDGTRYAWKGTPKLIPDDLLTFLSNLTGRLPEAKELKRAGDDGKLVIRQSPPDEDLRASEPAGIDEFIREVLPAWNFRYVPELIGEHWVLKRQGFCPKRAAHSGSHPDREKDFSIYWDSEAKTFKVGCWHGSCKEEIKALYVELNRKWEAQTDQRHEAVVKAVDEEIQTAEIVQRRKQWETTIESSIESAWAQAKVATARAVAILAPTGAGKSRRAALEIAERVRANLPVLYVGAQKRDMLQVYADLIPILTKQELAKVKLCDRDHGAMVDENNLAILTHRTYITRKPFSTFHYGVLLWLERIFEETGKRALVIIDEMAGYVEQQFLVVNVGCRFSWVKFKNHDTRHLERRSECPGFHNRPSCEKCFLTEKVFLTSDNQGIVSVRPFIDGATGRDFKPFEIKLATGPSAQFKTLTVKEVLNAGSGIMDYREYRAALGKGAAPDTPEEILADLVQCSYRPMEYTTNPVDTATGKTVDPWEIAASREMAKAKAETSEGVEGEEKEPDTELPCQFPKQACQVRRYGFWDKSGLYRVTHQAEKTILLNALLDEDSDTLDFVGECAGSNMLVIRVPESQQKLKAVALFLFAEKFIYVEGSGANLRVSTEPVSSIFMPNEKILAFLPTAAKAEEQFRDYPRGYPVGLIKADEVFKTERSEEEAAKINLTYPYGPLGQAVNRPKDRGCFVDAGIFQPMITLRPGVELSEKTIAESRCQKAIERTCQAFGRILRVNHDNPNGGKMIVVHNTKEIAELYPVAKLLANITPMAEHVELFEVRGSQDYLVKAICHWLETGKRLEQTEKDFVLENAAKKPLREITVGQRDKMTAEEKKEYYQRRNTAKAETKIEELIERGRKLIEMGQNWTTVYQKLRLYRLSKNDHSRIKTALGLQD